MDLDAIQAGRGGPGAALARAGLSLLALGYRAASGLRRTAYAAGLARRHALARPVLAVGNLVAGGTGKTPFTVWLARRLLAEGHRPGILARGYGARATGGTLSDEGAVRARLLGQDVPQVEDADRVAGARRLLEAHPGTDVLLLDDGFQHWRVRRDLDLVLLDATRPFGHDRLLPRGMLRERPAALRRAGVVVLTRTERATPEALDALAARVAGHTDAPVVRARTVPNGVRVGGRDEPPAWLRDRPVVAVCGIGNPQAFFAMLEQDLGARVLERIALGDHVRAPESVWEAATARAREAAPDAVVLTTWKDAVKREGTDDLAVLDIGLEIVEGEDLLDRRVATALRA